MSLPNIDNLQISKVTKNLLFVHQIKASAVFTRCDGLIKLPERGVNRDAIIIDLNIEPQFANIIYNSFKPITDYICSHTHLDHAAHVHVWSEKGVNIYAPVPEHTNLLDSYNFLNNFGFLKELDLETGMSFVNSMGYKKCNEVISFKPGDTLRFDNFELQTISFPGHSLGHIGFFLPSEKILHISCMGFDQTQPGVNGFGPWYGFRDCSIEQTIKDINLAEEIFLKKAIQLTSSHSYVVKNPDRTPFNYMRKKIEENQNKVNSALKTLENKLKIGEQTEALLKLDIFFPKRKMKGPMLKIYAFWESWIIRKHIERSIRKNL